MQSTDTVVIGAGHAGLAVSRLLTGRGRDHVVLDRGRVAERWRTERWDSLHLLTPTWMTRLPRWRYEGRDLEGYLAVREVVGMLERYAGSFDAPVRENTTVLDVSLADDGYRVTTDQGTWSTRHVVLATGPGSRPRLPVDPGRVAPGLHVLPASAYRNPDGLPAGAVLVVGASASGVQIADELARAGRPVVLSVGSHTRMPRRYRGMDVLWWLDRTGSLARTIDEVPDPAAARREPSMQLVGRHGGAQDLDLTVLQDRGVRLVGRLADLEGQRARFADDLADTTAAAERRMHRVLDTVDRHVEDSRLTAEVWGPDRPRPVSVPPTPAGLALFAEGVRTVLFATGYRQHLPWLRVPVLEPDGSVRQVRGRTPAPGLYVVGQRFQHRRDSSFIDGARHVAADVVAHLCADSDVRRELDRSGGGAR